MKISSALAEARQLLDSSGVSNSKLDALILLTHATNLSKEAIIFNPDSFLNSDQQKLFFNFIARRIKREPVSHIIARREFFGNDFFVDKDVLDPRPDSETLIEAVLKKFPNRNQELKILEIGVGSGCLIITLLKQYLSALAIGVDISDKALAIAKKNAQELAVLPRLELINSDIFSNLKEEKFDLIISNPPYIASDEIEFLQEEVRLFEPHLALDGGYDGLNFYRAIALNAGDFLKKNGKIIVEIGYGQEEKIAEIFAKNNFLLSEEKPDLAGIVRVLVFE